MIQYSVVTTLPNSEPVSLEEAKVHLEVDDDSKDDFIEGLITTARLMGEAYTGLSFVTQQRRITMDYFPCVSLQNTRASIFVPYGPVQSLSIVYIDSDGAEQTLVEDTDYKIITEGEVCRLVPLSDSIAGTWPTVSKNAGSITISYQAGFDDVSGQPLPKQIKTAILMQVGSMFENRQDEVVGTSVDPMNLNSKAIYDTVKVYWNAAY